jgi:hypothetical protein
MIPTTHRHLLLALACVWAMASVCRADIAASDIAALGDADFARRQAVMRKLLADESITPEQVAAQFAKAESVEQKHRLISLARHHLLRRARLRDFPLPARVVAGQTIPGALGLTHGPVISEDLPQLKQSAVRVRRILPGFPAYSALEVGDLIVGIEGNPIPAGFSAEQISRHFGDAIQMVQAGQSVQLQIYREGKTLDVKVKLALHASLGGMYQPELKTVYEREWDKFRADVLKEGK